MENQPFFMIHDFPDPNDPAGRSYKQVNAERSHAIPIGALVELETGERLRVVMHARDCDQTPMYSLGLKLAAPGHVRDQWDHGYAEEALKVISRPQ